MPFLDNARRLTASRAMRARRSSDLEIGGGRLAALAVGFYVESELPALHDTAHSGALYGRNVNEHVGAATLLLDEAEALLRVEELHSTSSHDPLLETHHEQTEVANSVRELRSFAFECARRANEQSPAGLAPVDPLGAFPLRFPLGLYLLLGHALAMVGLFGSLRPKRCYAEHRSLVFAMGDFAGQIEEVLRQAAIFFSIHWSASAAWKTIAGREGS